MKLVILQGLPASGKSTRADEILKESGNAVRINKDSIRTMMHFDKWSGRNEKATHQASRVLAEHFLKNGRTVVVDDTNLNPGVLQGWKDLAVGVGAHIEVVKVDTPLAECILRDAERGKRVGDSVITGMAMRYGLYPEPKNGIVICDLDGTLADITHRLHFVKKDPPREWGSFFRHIPFDELRKDVADIVLGHEASGREIFFVSGRPEEYRDLTERWLDRVFKGYRMHKALFMRHRGDKRPDTIVKQEIYEKYFKGRDVIEVIDDRPSVIRMWRELGLTVLDVGDGIEF